MRVRLAGPSRREITLKSCAPTMIVLLPRLRGRAGAAPCLRRLPPFAALARSAMALQLVVIMLLGGLVEPRAAADRGDDARLCSRDLAREIEDLLGLFLRHDQHAVIG